VKSPSILLHDFTTTDQQPLPLAIERNAPELLGLGLGLVRQRQLIDVDDTADLEPGARLPHREALDDLDGLVDGGDVEDAVAAETGALERARVDRNVAGVVGDNADSLLVGRVESWG
jgi:hypothetical protein